MKSVKEVTTMDNLEQKFLVHEAVCAERWKDTIVRIKRLEAILLSTAAAIILLLLGIILK